MPPRKLNPRVVAAIARNKLLCVSLGWKKHWAWKKGYGSPKLTIPNITPKNNVNVPVIGIKVGDKKLWWLCGEHVFHEECSSFHQYVLHGNTSKCIRSPRIPSCDRLSEYIFGRLYDKQVPHGIHLPVAFQPWTVSEASGFPKDLWPAMTPQIVQLVTKPPMHPVCPMSHQRNVGCLSHTEASVNPMVSILLQEHWPVWICKSSFCGVTLHHLRGSQVEWLSSGRCPGLMG